VGQPHHGAHVDPQQVLLVVAAHLVEGALRAQPRVVDQQVDALLAALLDRGALLVVGEVSGQHLDGDAARAQLLRQVVEAGDVAGDEHQVVPAAGQLTGEGGADACCRAGDECGGHGGAG
jgi:hypothetical protein